MAAAVLLLTLDALALTLGAFLLWLLALRIRDVSFVDAWWPLGMVIVGGLDLALAPRISPPSLLLFGLGLLWGLRLGLHLLLRWRRQGADPRYEALLQDAATRRGWSFSVASLLLVFALQAPLQLIVALPLELGQLRPPAALTPLGAAGALIACFGLGFEAAADAQLSAFKRGSGGPGRIMDRGLWRYSRHPNYFGEAVFWWGAFLLAASFGGAALAALPAPILITFLLTRGSGVPTVEGRMRMRGAAFEAYAARTSAFIPLPPRRRR